MTANVIEPVDYNENESLDFPVLGRNVGKATSWDQVDGFSLLLYNFIPSPEYTGPIADQVMFDFERGTVVVWNEFSANVSSMDIFDAIKYCNRVSS